MVFPLREKPKISWDLDGEGHEKTDVEGRMTVGVSTAEKPLDK